MKSSEAPILEYNFPLTYREAIVKQSMALLLNYESFSLVGMEDNAKSNLMRFIADREDVRNHYLKEKSDEYLFTFVDLNELMEISAQGFFRLLYMALDNPENKGAGGADAPEFLLKRVKSTIHQTIAATKRKLVLIFNDFDVLEPALQEQVARNLISVRNAARYQIIYVFITTRPPEGNQFFFKKVVWALPFSGKDALGVVSRNAVRYGINIPKTQAEKIIELSGGHAGLIKFIIQVLTRNPKTGLTARELARESDILFQCERLLYPLTEVEKAKLRSDIEDELLVSLGMQVRTPQGIRIFSPVLSEVLVAKPGLIKPFCYDQELNEIYLFGKPVKRDLNPKEFLLLTTLIKNPDKVFTRDELMEKIWGEDTYPNDWAYDKFISRLREKLNINKSDLLQTIRGNGLVLYG